MEDKDIITEAYEVLSKEFKGACPVEREIIRLTRQDEREKWEHKVSQVEARLEKLEKELKKDGERK